MLKYKIAAALLAVTQAAYKVAAVIEGHLYAGLYLARQSVLTQGRAALQAELNGHLRNVEVQRAKLAEANRVANAALKAHTGKVDALHAKVYEQ